MGYLEELLSGTPQAAATLKALLGQTKLGQNLEASHYGPQDSLIGSLLAHPVEGLQKARGWLDDQTLAAGNAPTQPMTDPAAAQAATQAGINLTGLLQTGAMPAAPSGYGVLGSIRRPQDMMVKFPEELMRGTKAEVSGVDKMWANYMNKSWLTEDDAIMKYLDSGGRISVPSELRGGEPAAPILPEKYAEINTLAEKFGYDWPKTKTSSVPSTTLIDKLQNGEKLSAKEKARLNDVSRSASLLREQLGGKQSAVTPAGRAFEDFNDLAGAHSLGNLEESDMLKTKARISSQLDPSTVPYWQNAIDQNKQSLESVLSSDYYNKNKDSINVFNPANSTGIIDSPTHINDMNPDVNPSRMSLSDLLTRTVSRDTEAVKKALKLKDDALKSEAMLKKEVVQELPDNHSWNKITDPAGLEAEGEFQGHCVGSYCEKVKKGTSEIYSLRGPDNKPLLTAEWDPKTKKLMQVKGRFNAEAPKSLKPSIKSLERLLANR